MPIQAVATGTPPSRTKDEKLAAAMADLADHYRAAKERRDTPVEGRPVDLFTILTLEAEEEAKLYSRAFHRLAQNDARVAQTRLNGAKLSVRVQPADTARRTRKPKEGEANGTAPVEATVSPATEKPAEAPTEAPKPPAEAPAPAPKPPVPSAPQQARKGR